MSCLSVTMVPIDVRAFDRCGKPVTDLAAGDFEIFEDGVPQRIAHFSTQAYDYAADLVGSLVLPIR